MLNDIIYELAMSIQNQPWNRNRCHLHQTVMRYILRSMIRHMNMAELLSINAIIQPDEKIYVIQPNNYRLQDKDNPIIEPDDNFDVSVWLSDNIISASIVTYWLS